MLAATDTAMRALAASAGARDAAAAARAVA
jgi:hypothetical protein